MKSSLFCLLTLALLLCTIDSFGQKRNKSRVTLSPKKIHKLPKVDLELLDKSYPRSFLYKVDRSSVTLINRSYHRQTYKPMYFQGKLGLDQIKSMTIHDRKRRFKTNAWGALIGGVAGYLVGKAIAPDDFSQVSIEILSQQPKTGFIEPIIGTIVGASLGIAIGDLFTPIRIEDVNENPRKTSLYLRGLQKKKNKKKKRSRR